ncbi:hypothetical protein QJQ45_024705 [Haematococcus lacustris]|nr:hypothetical protein QJQ45_024705 [Haematococcus lacustris]
MAAYQPGQIAGVAYSSDRHQQWHQFLTAYGLDLDSQSHVIETCPELLDTDIYSAGMVILLFKAFGYTDKDICSRILTMYPFLLAKSITRDLQPVLEHLEGAGCKGNDLRLLMWEYPRIFSNDFRRQARRFARLGILADRITIAPGLKVSRMGLGTWSWGNQFLWGYRQEQDAELQQVFNLVVQRGLNLFDTADSYGTATVAPAARLLLSAAGTALHPGRLDGRSEKLLGRFMQECPKRKADLVIATKLAGYPWRVLPSLVVDAAKASCERLGTQQLGLVQLHWSASNYAPWQELAQQAGLADCYDQGLCKAVGVSNFGAKRLRQLHAYLSKRGVPLATVQIQFSLLSRTPLVLETKAVADELGIRLISYSPLALGLLSGKYSQDSLPSGPRGLLFRSLLPEIQPLLSTMEAIGNERNKTMSQVAINWCCAKGTIPIPGARTLSQAQEALGALDWLLSDGEVAELDAAAARTPKAMVQNIFQTS